jgi:hypothetical protein
VAYAADQATPLHPALVADVMNLLMSRDCVRDLHSLRIACKLRCSLLELLTGLVESFVGGLWSHKVPFHSIRRAFALHREVAAVAVAAAASARAAAARIEAETEAVLATFQF